MKTKIAENNKLITDNNTFENFIKRIKNCFLYDRDFTLFLIVGSFTGIASGINTTVFNNFLSDVFKLSASGRGIVEFPREFPGALIVVVLGLLSFMGDIRIAIIGMICACLGMLGLGLFSPTFASMLVWMMTLSLGTHIFLPLSSGIGMKLSSNDNYGMRLGKYNAYNLLATILGYGIVWIGFKYLGLTYRSAFIIASVSYVFAAFSLGLMHKGRQKHPKMKFVFRKKYTLYYCMSIVNGARKQIFMTFAPWVLIKVFGLTPPAFALLGVIVSIISIMSRTIVGNAIDTKGERFVLSLEAILLIILCMGYSFAEDIAPKNIALIIIAACYVIDNSLNAVEMARSTYVRKIAVYPEDVIPTLSAGTSFDHIIAMSVPFLGGLLWASLGYKYVFLAAAVIALLNLFMSTKIKIE